MPDPVTPEEVILWMRQRKRMGVGDLDVTTAAPAESTKVPVEDPTKKKKEPSVPGGRRGQQAIRLAHGGGLPKLAHQPTEEELATKMFVNEYFNFSDLSLPQRVNRLTTAGLAILGNLAAEAIWQVPQNAFFRAVQGESLMDNMAKSAEELSAPTMRKLFAAAPFLPQDALRTMIFDPNKGGQVAQETLGEAFIESLDEDPITWKAALNESTVPWSMAQWVYAPLGLSMLYNHQTQMFMDEHPGVENPTIGQMTTFLDRKRIEERRDATEMIVSHLPEGWMNAKVTIPKLGTMTVGEALIEAETKHQELRNEAYYAVGDLVLDPLIIDDLAGGVVVNAAAKAGTTALKFVPRSVAKASRLGAKLRNVEPVVEEAAKTTTSTYRPLFEVVRFRPMEEVPHGPITSLPTDLRRRRLRTPLDVQPRETRAAEGYIPPSQRPEWTQEVPTPAGGPRATEGDKFTAQHMLGGAAAQGRVERRIAESYEELEVLAKESKRVGQDAARAAAQNDMDKFVELQEQFGALEEARAAAEAQLTKFEKFQTTQMQAARVAEELGLTPDGRLPIKKLADDPDGIAGGLEVKGLPQGLKTVEASKAPKLGLEHALMGLIHYEHGKVAGGKLIPGTTLQHSFHAVRPNQMKQILKEGFSQRYTEVRPSGGGPARQVPTGLTEAGETLVEGTQDIYPNEFLMHYIRRAGNLGPDAGWELQAIYKTAYEGRRNSLIPLVTEGGVPMRKFPGPVLDDAARAARVAKSLERLDTEEPLHHHTSLSKGFSMLYDRKIRAAGGEYRSIPTVSFTRQDVTKLPGQKTIYREAGPPPGPTTSETFLGQFGALRLITTRQRMKELPGKLEPFHFRFPTTEGKMAPSGKSRFYEAEERFHGDVPLDAILKVEIDPTEFAARTAATKEASYNMLDAVIKGFEDQGIPVEIKPLFLQNEIETFRPRSHPKYYLEKIAKGQDSAENANRVIRHVATTRPLHRADGTVVPAAEVAATYIEQGDKFDMPSDRVGKHVEEKLGSMLGTETPVYQDASKVLEDIFEETTGAVGKGYKLFIPDATPVIFPGGGRKGPRYLDLNHFQPDQRLLPPPKPVATFGELNPASALIDEPIDALSKINHPNAPQIWNRLTEARYELAMFMDHVDWRLRNVEKLIRKSSDNDGIMFDMLNTKPDTPEFVEMWKAATPEHKSSYRETRRALDEAWDLMVERGVIDPSNAKSPGYLRGYAPHIFPQNSDIALGAIPYGLHDVPLNGNVMLGHIKHRYGSPEYIRSAMASLRAYFMGVGQKTFMEPMYNDILKLAGAKVKFDPKTGRKVADSAVLNFPQVGRKYVEDLVREMKGYPSTAQAKIRHWLRVADDPNADPELKALAKAGRAVDTLVSFVSNGLYRGLLMGSPHYWAQNFFTQGVLNPSALHGPFWTMRGIARHGDAAWRGLEPQPALLGGFHALFEDLPIPNQSASLVEKLRQQPGIQQFSALMKEVEKRGGVQQVEAQMRGIAFHIGFGKQLQVYEAQLGKTVTPHNIHEVLTPGQIKRAMLEGMKTSDNINFIYGVYGANPTLRHFFGGKSIAVTFQFMSYYGKELAFLERNARVRQDPGLWLRYLETWGIMSRMMGEANISADEFNIFNEISEVNERFVEHNDAPVGPVPQMMLNFWRATTTEDNTMASRDWTEFARSMTNVTPNIQGVRTVYRAIERQQTGLRFNPVTGEVMRTSEPSELLPNLFGLTSKTEGDYRREMRTVKRMDRAVTEMLETMDDDFRTAQLEENQEEIERVRRLADRFHLLPPAMKDTKYEQLLYSRLSRMIQDTQGSWELEMYVQQLREDFKEWFDETQAIRFLQYLERKREAQEDIGMSEENLKTYRDKQDAKRWLRLRNQTGGKNVPRP